MAKRKQASGGAGGLPPFAAKLKAIRARLGLTQGQLARKAGLHLGAVFKLEQGQREPAWSTVQALCKALGVGCDEFLNAPETPSGQAEARSGPASRGRPKTRQRSTGTPGMGKRKGK